MVLVSSPPGRTAAFDPLTKETFLKGTQARIKPLLEPQCFGVGLQRFYVEPKLN